MNEMVFQGKGRPLKFQNVKAFQKQVDSYFERCEETGEPVTVSGLCLALDTSREVLLDYQNKDDFTDTITRAKLKCMHYAEKQLYLAKSANGPIFALKNFGWSDRQEIDVNNKDTKINITLSGDIDGD